MLNAEKDAREYTLVISASNDSKQIELQRALGTIRRLLNSIKCIKAYQKIGKKVRCRKIYETQRSNVQIIICRGQF